VLLGLFCGNGRCNGSFRLSLDTGIVIRVIQLANIASLLFDKIVRFLGTPTALLVHDRRHLFVFNLVQDRRKNFPRPAELVVAHKGGVLALQHVQNETRVGVRVGFLLVRKEAGIVVDFQFRLHRFGGEAGTLDVGFEVHGFVRLHAHDEFVAGALFTLKQEFGRGRVLELDAHFRLALVEGLARLENKGDTGPARGVDAQKNDRKRWRIGALVFDRWVVWKY